MSLFSLAARIAILEELIEAVGDYVPETQGSRNLEATAKAWLSELKEEQTFHTSHPEEDSLP